jgi:hypothetical protein
MAQEEVNDDNLAKAFPRALRADALRVVAAMPRVGPGCPKPTPDPIQRTPHVERPLSVGGEPVHIPSRIYHDPMSPSDVLTAISLTPVQRTILACLYTRHHHGHVRQRWLRTIASATEPWVAPFVVNLVGEYVVEIIVDIHRALLPALDDPASPHFAQYGTFLAENPEFLALTRQRVASYWDCYYRRRYLSPADYPAHPLIAALTHAARTHSAHA